MPAMNKSRFSLPFVATLSVLCLVLGGLGTATASGLTAHTVRKIAAKVVKKKAKKLSVAHAVSADSATSATTAQRAGSVTTYSFTLPVKTDAVTARTFTFPGLPAGTYLASYDVRASLTSGSFLGCGFNINEASTFDVAAGNSVQLTGSGVVTVSGSLFTLLCNTGSVSFALTSADPSTVSFVPVTATESTAGGG
jgi:hypothetical protein